MFLVNIHTQMNTPTQTHTLFIYREKVDILFAESPVEVEAISEYTHMCVPELQISITDLENFRRRVFDAFKRQFNWCSIAA